MIVIHKKYQKKYKCLNVGLHTKNKVFTDSSRSKVRSVSMETNPIEMKPYELCSLSESLNGIVHVVLSQDSF